MLNITLYKYIVKAKSFDTLVFDVHESELDQMKALVQQEMEAAVQLAVPMEVEIEVADNWLNAHEG